MNKYYVGTLPWQGHRNSHDFYGMLFTHESLKIRKHEVAGAKGLEEKSSRRQSRALSNLNDVHFSSPGLASCRSTLSEWGQTLFLDLFNVAEVIFQDINASCKIFKQFGLIEV